MLKPFEKKLSSYLKDSERWPDQPSAFVVGFSGGPDSTALVLALSRLLPGDGRSNWILAHFEHGWRPETAKGESDYCRGLADKLGFNYTQGDPTTICRDGLPSDVMGETAARRYRRRFLEETSTSLGQKLGLPTYVVLAHHMNDQAETLLMHLFRGTGLRGAVGMRPWNGMWLRPLLAFSKQELLDYLIGENQTYLTDPSNLESLTPRNCIRLEMLPLAESIYGTAVVNRLAAFCRRMSIYDDEAVKRLLTYTGEEELFECRFGVSVTANEPDSTDKGVIWREALEGKAIAYCISTTFWRDLPGTLRPRLLEMLINRLSVDGDGLTEEHLERVSAAIERGVSVAFPGYQGQWVCVGQNELRIWRHRPDCPLTALWVTLPSENAVDERRIYLLGRPEMRIKRIVKENRVRYNHLMWITGKEGHKGLTWRFRREGDYIVLADGGHKSLKKFLGESGVPRELRASLALLADGGEIVWIPGLFARKRLESQKNWAIYLGRESEDDQKN